MCLRRAATLFATCMYSVNHYCTMVVCGLQRYGFVIVLVCPTRCDAFVLSSMLYYPMIAPL